MTKKKADKDLSLDKTKKKEEKKRLKSEKQSLNGLDQGFITRWFF